MTLVSVGELRSRLGIQDSDDDYLLSAAVSAASSRVQAFCGRAFASYTGVRNFVIPNGRMTHLVDLPDLATATGLVVVDNGTTIDPTGYQLEPIDQVGHDDSKGGWPYTTIRRILTIWTPSWAGRPTLAITGTWGWPAIPEPVKAATLQMAADIYRQKDAVFAGVGHAPSAGIQLDDLSISLLRPYQRQWGFA